MDVQELKNRLGAEFGDIFDIINPILINLNISKKAKILDIGTGKGKMAITLAFNGYRVITGEPESDDSKYAKRDWLNDAKKANLDHMIEFKHFNAEKLPFEDDSFDAIFIHGTYHHISDRRSAFKEFIRTLREDGFICIIEPTRKGIKKIRKKNPSHPDAVDPTADVEGLQVEIKKGLLFDAFIFTKP